MHLNASNFCAQALFSIPALPEVRREVAMATFKTHPAAAFQSIPFLLATWPENDARRRFTECM
jgi:hypothetical protein